MSSNRKLKYSLAINEALCQLMKEDPSILLLGQGVKSVWYVGETCNGLIEKFSEKRIIDTPISENGTTGIAVGAALTGMRSVILYPRMDFMMYALDPIINEAANWSYMMGGEESVPVVFWGVINRKGEQAAQHSQAFQALFAHIPGLKVVIPSSSYDAKGLMISAVREDNPVVFIDDRLLYNLESEVPKEMYEVPIGKADIKKEGKDITIIATSFMVKEALSAAGEVEEDIEVLDLRSLKPLDR